MAERDDRKPPPSRDVAGDDFLFHLYRGSEMLQDNRVHDAKAELEQALSLQPSDPKGQDLLGIVYFRLGLYPRAIAIYERLIQLHPDALEPRINLALSYLKTGQPAQARFELERVVDQNPSHSRAWGYLGLAFQRLGDYERAGYAFSVGGHDGMARRLVELSMTAAASHSLRPEALPPHAPQDEVLEVHRVPTLPEIDTAGEVLAFRPDSQVLARKEMPTLSPPSGPVTAPDGAARPAIAPPPRVPQIDGPVTSPQGSDVAAGAPRAATPRASFLPPGPAIPPPPPSAPRRSASAAPRKASEIAREKLLVFPRDLRVGLHDSGVVLVQATTGFAARLDAVRSLSYAAGYGTATLLRRTRGRLSDEPLGGAASPLTEITGKGELVLGPARGQRLEPIQLDDEPFYLREEALAGFESGVTYESGRLAVGDGEALSLVQLRGPGAVIAALPEGATALEIVDARTTAVRAVSVLGWVGRLVPRALPASEAPAGARGFVAFAGEGMVLIDGR